jgi:hypothetical protein
MASMLVQIVKERARNVVRFLPVLALEVDDPHHIAGIEEEDIEQQIAECTPYIWTLRWVGVGDELPEVWW